MQKTSYKEYCKALGSIQTQFPMGCGVRIRETGSSIIVGRPEVCVRIDWDYHDGMTANETRKFAKMLVKAAELVEQFPYNGYMVERGNFDE